MQRRTKAILIILLVSATMVNGTRYPAKSFQAAADKSARIHFEVSAFEERDGKRNPISETTIDGPAGTDFSINLQGSRFQMNTKFLTDLVAPDTLKIRSRLKTRRLYGYSERNLPLYEEDTQNETFELGSDEKLVLLPFGRNDNNGELKIEITPTISTNYANPKPGKARSIEINIPMQSPGGAISVEASKIPHNYLVEAALVEDGQIVARNEGHYRIEEPNELILRPASRNGSTMNPGLIIKLTIDQFLRSAPTRQVGVSFSVYRTDTEADSKPQMVMDKAAGIGELASELIYELHGYDPGSTGKRYQLKLKIKLAPGENSD